MFAVQRVVMAVIFEPDTPGGLRLSIDCRMESSSATADDIVYQWSPYGCGGDDVLQQRDLLTRKQAPEW